MPNYTFRDFEQERSYHLGLPSRKLPGWKRWLAPWAHIKDSFTSSSTRYFVRPAPPAVYVRIPKAASTAVLSTWLPQMAVGLPSLPSDEELEAYAHRMAVSALPASVQAYPRFTLVRHPVRRFLSVYQSYFQKPDTPFPFSHYLWGVLRPGMSLDELISAVEQIPDRFRDPHLMSQVRLMGGPKHLPLVKRYRLEELTPSTVLPEIGLPLPLRNASGAMLSISQEQEQRIRALYQVDLEQLGYTD